MRRRKPTPDPDLADERRRSARSPLFVLVRCADGEPLWAFDLGLGGMKATTRQARWPGTFLDLSFELPDSRESVQVGGQVTMLDASDTGELTLGVRFCRPNDAAALAIYRFLDRRRRLWEDQPLSRKRLPEA